MIDYDRTVFFGKQVVGSDVLDLSLNECLCGGRKVQQRVLDLVVTLEVVESSRIGSNVGLEVKTGVGQLNPSRVQIRPNQQQLLQQESVDIFPLALLLVQLSDEEPDPLKGLLQLKNLLFSEQSLLSPPGLQQLVVLLAEEVLNPVGADGSQGEIEVVGLLVAD
jgi:hypothetical protein